MAARELAASVDLAHFRFRLVSLTRPLGSAPESKPHDPQRPFPFIVPISADWADLGHSN